MKKTTILFIFMISINIIASIAWASNIEGTSTYKDYLFILVHGINGGSNHFNGQDGRDKELRLQQYLENDMGLTGRVYAYSFKDKNVSGDVEMEIMYFKDNTVHSIRIVRDATEH